MAFEVWHPSECLNEIYFLQVVVEVCHGRPLFMKVFIPTKALRWVSVLGVWEGRSDSHGVRLWEGFKKGLEDSHCYVYFVVGSGRRVRVGKLWFPHVEGISGAV